MTIKKQSLQSLTNLETMGNFIKTSLKDKGLDVEVYLGTFETSLTKFNTYKTIIVKYKNESFKFLTHEDLDKIETMDVTVDEFKGFVNLLEYQLQNI